MAPLIRIDDETMAMLKQRAIELDMVFDSPNSVLRKVLDVDAKSIAGKVAANMTAIESNASSPKLKYVSRAKHLYDNKEINAEEYISRIWDGIRKAADNERVVERATIAFLKLYDASKNMPVEGEAILDDVGFVHYHGSSHGLWPWLAKNANVIKQTKNASGQKVYSVNDTFYDVLRKVCLAASDES